MSLSEIIATLALYLGDSTQPVITSKAYCLEVSDDYIEVYFSGGKSAIRIFRTGKAVFLDE